MSSQEEIRGALDRAARTITQKPSIGQRVYTNIAVVENGLACRMQEKNHVLTADLPRSMGGDDSGPSPSVLLRAALSSCVAMGVKMWAARRDIAIDRIEVRIETDVDARGQFGVSDTIAPGFEDVRVHIFVESDADAEMLREVVQTSLRYSPLMDAFCKSLSVTTQISFDHRALEDH